MLADEDMVIGNLYSFFDHKKFLIKKELKGILGVSMMFGNEECGIILLINKDDSTYTYKKYVFLYKDKVVYTRFLSKLKKV